MGIIARGSSLVKIYDATNIDEAFLDNDSVKSEIKSAFAENRAFPFFPGKDILSRLSPEPGQEPGQEPGLESVYSYLSDFKNSIFQAISRDNPGIIAGFKRDRKSVV